MTNTVLSTHAPKPDTNDLKDNRVAKTTNKQKATGKWADVGLKPFQLETTETALRQNLNFLLLLRRVKVYHSG